MNEFADKVALVTGGATGIGLGAVEAFAAKGAHVVMADVDRHAGEAAALRIVSGGGKVAFEACDVSNAAEVEALFERIGRDFGRLDFGINNAGIDLESATEPAWDVDAFDRVMAVNLRGVFLCMRGEIALMRRGGGGAIVNISSTGGLRAEPNKPCYIASKHGVMGLTKSAARQLAPEGIRINALCPGPIRTVMLQESLDRFPGGEAMVKQMVPARRFAEVEEAADAILWLCSGQSAYVVGHGLVIDGGIIC